MTNSVSNEFTVFKSGDTKSFAQAAMALKSRGVAFRIAVTYEGAEPALRIQWLVVNNSDADMACDAVRDIPSEIILSPTVSKQDSELARFVNIIQLVALAVIILIAILVSLMNK